MQLNWLEILISLALGAAVTVLLTRLLRERPGLSATLRTSTLIAGGIHPNDITVHWHGKPVPQVSETRLALWNSGRVALGRDKLVDADPLRIVLNDGAEILRLTSDTATRQIVDLTPQPLGLNQAVITFEYLEPGDGAVIRVLHTGTTARLAGTVRDLPKGVTMRPSRYDDTNWFIASMSALLVSTMATSAIFPKGSVPGLLMLFTLIVVFGVVLVKGPSIRSRFRLHELKYGR